MLYITFLYYELKKKKKKSKFGIECEFFLITLKKINHQKGVLFENHLCSNQLVFSKSNLQNHLKKKSQFDLFFCI